MLTIPGVVEYKTVPSVLMRFKCSICSKEKPCVVKLERGLVCINCRYNDIGKDALFEALYNGMD
jgi:hypothetical protein